MGITVHYKTITPEDFERLQTNPEAANSFLSSESSLSLEKSWHVIHYLLTDHPELGDHTFTDPPLGTIVLGGRSTQFQCSYGMVRYLMPEEVAIAAEALNTISLESLEVKCDAESFNSAEVYPLGRRGEWDEDEIEGEIQFLRLLYPALTNFFKEAANNGHIVLIASD